MKRFFVIAALLLGLAGSASAEEVKIVTYNVERWAERFDSRQVRAWARKQPQSEELKQLVDTHVRRNDRLNWAVATVIQKMDPDILVFQEGCNQEDLNYFGQRWLQDTYPTMRVFPSNTGREQHIGLIAKPGFKVLKVMDQYHKEKNPQPVAGAAGDDDGAGGDLLFARGPAFALMQSPGGRQFWVGVNHHKSKSGNSVAVARWRNREAVRAREIIKELEKAGPADVVYGGDLNDEIGMQEFEQQAGGDSIALMVGPPQDGLVLATAKLADANAVSFGGYFSDRYRSFIDHFFVTKSLKDKIVDVKIINDGLAPIASDHYPVMLTLKF